ncbi:MAG: hypothetical protein WDM71_11035 [Ferruginibacter sp.]
MMIFGLYRKDSTGTITKLIDGVNGILDKGNNVLKLKVTRDSSDHWTLYRDISGTGNNYFNEGAVVDSVHTTSSYLEFLFKQSTASFFRKTFFDDIEITSYTPDITAPDIRSVVATSSKTLDVLFSEPLDTISSQNVGNYFASNGLSLPDTAILDSSNQSLVHLGFANNFPNGINCSLVVNGVKDPSGNSDDNDTALFSFYTPHTI